MDIGRTILLNSKARHRIDAGTFGMNSILLILQKLRSESLNHFIDENYTGTMGVGPGFGIASAVYCQDHAPEKRVICVEGDSAFGFSGLEFETAAR